MRNWFALIIVAILLGTAIAVAMNPTIIQNTGQIKTVDVEADVTSLDWGIVDPGAIVTKTVQVRPTGNVPVTLTFTLSNWQPAAATDYFTVTWDYTGAEIPLGVWTPIQFTLEVSASISGIVGFSFDVTITATA